MKKWASVLTLMGAGVLGAGEPAPANLPGRGVDMRKAADTPLPDIRKYTEQAEEPADVDIVQFKNAYAKQNRKEKAEGFRQLNAKQQKAFFDSLNSDQKMLLAQAEIDEWTTVNNHVRPSAMLLLDANQEYMHGLMTFAYEPIDVVAIGLKDFKEKLAPKIHRVNVRSLRGNAYASGMIMEATIDPSYNIMGLPENPEPRFARADFAIDQPGGMLRISGDGKHVYFSFPHADKTAKRNIELIPADVDALYQKVTEEEFKVENSFVPMQQDTSATARDISLPMENFGWLGLNTAPGAVIDFTGFKGVKDKPFSVTSNSNANFLFDNHTRNVSIYVNSLGYNQLPYQKVAILEVSPEIAKNFSVKYENGGRRTIAKGDEELVIDGSRRVIITDAERGNKFTSGGDFMLPDPDLEKAGIKIDGINSTLRIRSGNHYVDVPLMRDTDYVAADEQLEAAIRRATAALEAKVKGVGR
jgi:hypothetical protein